MSLTKKLLLLLLLVLSQHVNSNSIVEFLPGFEGPLPFELETGYIGIGEEEEVQLFYYFIKSEKNPKEDPLLLWLAGGPGCSSLAGFLLENGPVALKSDVYNGSVPSLISSSYSWTKVANIIFLDQPVGSGFSYSKTSLGKTSDTDQVKMIHKFLQKWLNKHPQFFSNPFYVTGDSYSGKTIPALVQKISKGNYICCEPLINLQGYTLGNPITSPEFPDYRILFSYGMGLISEELYESLRRNCKGNYRNVNPSNTKCLKHIEEYNKCTDNINRFHTLLQNCDVVENPSHISPACYYYVYYLIERWVNNKRVRQALHIRKGTKGQWSRCNVTIPYDSDIISSIPYHLSNSISGYRSLIYSGDHDMEVPFQSTEAWIKSLNYSIIDDWRPWMIKDQIAGYTRTYSNKMTFATIKGGGHTVEYKPVEGFIMFQRWLSGQPL